MAESVEASGGGREGAPGRGLFTVVFFGKTGAGKSSTLNSLFGLNLATDNAVACTRLPHVTELGRETDPELLHPLVRVVDLPGIGESTEADEAYWPFYETWVPRAQSLVWVTQADTRAYKSDEIFLNRLAPLMPPRLLLTIALNRVDSLGVDEGQAPFDRDRREPSRAQLRQLPAKVRDVKKILCAAAGRGLLREPRVVPYTAFYGWNLSSLKRQIMGGAD